MPIYTFYPVRPDGSANTFQALELMDDAGAERHVRKMLADHISCSGVLVWRDDRLVSVTAREVDLAPAD